MRNTTDKLDMDDWLMNLRKKKTVTKLNLQYDVVMTMLKVSIIIIGVVGFCKILL